MVTPRVIAGFTHSPDPQSNSKKLRNSELRDLEASKL